ncbi:hypothetical protein Pmani_029049 [Petrolisthes manimaculis]|uniref:Uncharacterized protein n=1 Tax=Petrolisthes manimaculis TaxID=1843537 RepID=A0AAE1NZF8_9EUCA|nr:hypothetical protein Pmani_029049 [Petrolisthes manimaculis]
MTGGGTKAFTYIEEAMAQVIEKVQVLGIPVDSKTQAALLKKTWMKMMWLTQGLPSRAPSPTPGPSWQDFGPVTVEDC